ncbi:hypothetical protein [Waddlia chondrophila]|uniref:Uncharacterized protein n=1 Tax=Waddlia chondrophila (strain ATCC VR-1470 / WSU 86-1044) TaxID=716544 RepID=D6YRT4_WADCW|nr:hypothetical protein [Waddlia chondrophila]ADI38779.1 hypothetical protein wcw_1429 [Waddlia chondrophila WSU 86-1044]
MNFDSRAVIIGVNLRDLESQISGKHLFVDVVFIDRSNEILHPLLYQLNAQAMRSDQDLEQFRRNGYLSLGCNAFAMVGEVIGIDKKKKQIHLRNNDSVTYKHLITATGLSQTQMGSVHDQEMTAGFHTLSEALRINKNARQLHSSPSFEHLRFNKQRTHALTKQKTADESTIQNLIKTLSQYDSSKPLEMTLAGTSTLCTSHRLYEVQL